jgi:hypothetical protein
MVRIKPEYRRSKLDPGFIGPAKVTEVHKDGNEVKVEFLEPGIQQRITTYSVSEVLFFDYNYLHASSLGARKFAAFLASKQFEIHELRDIKEGPTGFTVITEWSSGDVAEEPLATIHADAPLLLQNLLADLDLDPAKRDVVARVRAILKPRAPGKRA